MTTKLTLSIDKDVIKQSKKFAAAHNRSLSDLIESYLKAITSAEGKNIKVTDKVSSLRGSFKVPEGFDYMKVLVDEIIRKHG